MARERIPITREGLEALRQEYEYLVKHRRPEIARVIQEAREHGDIRENAAYDAAKHDQAFIEVVRVGSTVTIEIDGEIETYTIVGAIEAKPSAGRISNESPVGRALLGHRAGEIVPIETPNGTLMARIIEVQ
jgi:transcription elongation factor GreA